MDRELTLDQMMQMEGHEIEFVVERTLPALFRDGPQATFSEAAMEALNWQMSAWVGSRIMREHARIGVMPQEMIVTVSVQLDTETANATRP